jgi:hypothetical protein
MNDLATAVVILLALSIGVFWAVRVAARRLSPAAGVLLLALTLALIVAYALLLHGSLLLAKLLPLSSVIVLGNWFPILISVCAAVVVSQDKLPKWRRAALTIVLVCLAVGCLLYPLRCNPPRAGHSWTVDGVCLQTTQASCSPCAAATLLRQHGIAATETEMMRLCLTHRNATWQLGLYRGLKIKTRNTEWDVEPFSSTPDDLEQSGQFPVLLLVKLVPGQVVDRRYQEQWGWEPGLGHAVVVFDFDGQLADVGDPSVGREFWTLKDIDVLWQGQGLRLVRRQPQGHGPR